MRSIDVLGNRVFSQRASRVFMKPVTKIADRLKCKISSRMYFKAKKKGKKQMNF